VTQRSDRPIVGRRPVIEALNKELQACSEGPVSVLLGGLAGSGRRRLVAQFLERLREDEMLPTVVRVHFEPGDDGVRTLLRFFGAAIQGLARSEAFDTDPCESLEEAAAASDDDQVAEWLRDTAANITALRDHSGNDSFQIKLPRRNPWSSLLYTFDVLGPRCNWIVDLHDIGAATSPGFWTFLSALLGRARSRNWKMMFLAAPGTNHYGEKPGDEKPGPSVFLHSLFGEAQVVDCPALTADDLGELLAETYRPNDFPDGLAKHLHEVSLGHPETLHEVLDALEEDETITWDDDGFHLSSLDDVDLEVLVPIANEEDDDEGADEPMAEGRVAPKLLEQVLYLAAVEGRNFTASLIRTWLDAGEDEVDDALDAMPQLVEEDRYHEALGTWTYRFRYDFYRQWYVNNPPEGFHQKAQEEVAAELARILLQSYAPAALEYVPRAARLYTDAGDSRGARNLLALAMSAERPELCDFAIEITERFSDSPFPPGLVRYLYCSTADRSVNGQDLERARKAVNRARAWAERQDDASTQAYLELLDCRILLREGKGDEARARGESAVTTLLDLGDSTRAGETLNQLAMIALGAGDAKAVETYLRKAKKASNIPPVQSHTLYIEGILKKRGRNLAAAAEAFARSAELATEAGNLLLSLEAMLNQSECSLMVGRAKEVAPTLERALEMSRALRTPPRERAAARLLCQAEAARGNGEAAYEMARHALELGRELAAAGGQGGPGSEAVDLYHCGMFAAMAGKTDEALNYLKGAEQACQDSDASNLLPEVLFHQGQLALVTEDLSGAQSLLERGLSLVQQAGDRNRELRFLEQLGTVLSATGDHSGAANRFKEAADRALGPQAKEFRKSLRKRIADEQKRARAEG